MMHLLDIPDLPLGAFRPEMGRMRVYGKADAPPPPDYEAAARATAMGNLQAAEAATKANRVNTYTPYGSLTYKQNVSASPTFDQAGYDAAMKAYNANKDAGHYEIRFGGGEAGDSGQVWVPDSTGAAPTREQFTKSGQPDGTWSSTITLDPAQQKLLESQNAASQGLANLTGAGVDRVESALAQPLPGAYDPTKDTNNATNLINARLLPQQQRDMAALETQLANQGITLGSDAYRQAIEGLGRTQNDARQQAALQGISLGQQQQQQTYQQALTNRNVPLNDLSALRTGSQVTNPTFANAPQQATTAGPDLLGAASQGYNAQMQSVNANNANSAGMFGGLTSLGGLGLKAYGMGLFSDKRLKHEIRAVGKLDNGLTVYSYRYKAGGPTQIGVMAQEVMHVNPDAVQVHESGYLMVDYGAL